MTTLMNRNNPRVIAVLEALVNMRDSEHTPADLVGKWIVSLI